MRWIVSALIVSWPGLAGAVTVDELLQKVDKNMTYDTRESYAKMTVTKGSRVKVYRMHSYGRGADDAAVEYLEPARDKGTKMLKKDEELWTWMPAVEKTQKISGHMLRQSMMGSDLSYEDMMEAASWRTLYKGEVVGEELVDGRKAWKLDLKATSPQVSYPRRVAWIDQQSFVPVKQELYALSGMLLKTWQMGDIKKIGDREFPMRMTIRDQVQQGSSTELYFEDIKFAVPLQEEVFSVRWLER